MEFVSCPYCDKPISVKDINEHELNHIYKKYPPILAVGIIKYSGMVCDEIGHSFVIDTSFVNSGSCRRCKKIKKHDGEWI